MSKFDEHIDPELFASGRAEAEREIAVGQLGYREYGKLVAWWSEVAAILESEYGINLQVVGECISTLDVASRAEGYNQRMAKEIQDRFGADVVEETFRRVDRKRKKSGGM